MPGGFPVGPGLCRGTSAGADTTTSLGTSISNASANTKGSFVQLVASTAADANFMSVCITITSSVISFAHAVDIAVGGAGSEQVIYSNLLVQSSATTGTANYLLPCSIPAGTRVSARAQGDAGSDACFVSVQLFDSAFTSIEGAGADSIGFNTGTTKGTAIDPGTSANTVGSYAQLTSSTSRDYSGFYAAVDCDQLGKTNAAYLLDIAIGGSGSEQIIVPQVSIYWNGFFPPLGPFMIEIPSGTRIAARAQSAITAAARVFCLTLYGVYQ